MKEHLKFFWVGMILLLLFIIVSAFTFQRSSDLIKEGYLASEGSAAENFAVLTAANIHLADLFQSRIIPKFCFIMLKKQLMNMSSEDYVKKYSKLLFAAKLFKKNKKIINTILFAYKIRRYNYEKNHCADAYCCDITCISLLMRN